MKRHLLILFIAASLGACTQGGSANVNPSGEQFQSDALIQFLPYEVLKNLLIDSLRVSASSDCITELEENKLVFGAFAPGGGRSEGFSVARFRSMASIADSCCMEADNDLLFDTSDPVSPEKIWKRVVGRELSDTEREAFDALMAVDGYQDTQDRQQAICVATLNSLAAQLK